MSPGPEFENVGQPFLDQFVSMSWKHTTRNRDHATTWMRRKRRVRVPFAKIVEAREIVAGAAEEVIKRLAM